MLSTKISIQDAYASRQQGIDRQMVQMGVMLAGMSGAINAEYTEVAAEMVDVVYDAKSDESLPQVALKARRHCFAYLKKKLPPGKK
jgi:hypothetical protein